MADDRSKAARRWPLYGCLGIVAFFAIVVVWVVSVVGTAMWRARSEVVETREVSREVSGETASSSGEAHVGRVELDFEVGEFQIRPGEAGEPIRASAEFDGRSYELTEVYEPPAEAGWTYRLVFDETHWFADGGLRALFGGSFPKVTVTLPPDVPMALSGKFGKGVAILELGGLSLTEIDLEFEKGAMDVDFDRPLAAPAERVSLRSKQGALSAQRLGNASPRTLEIVQKMGGLSVNLDGAWVRDADVRIVQSMGGGDLRLPDGVEIEGLPTFRGATSSPERPVPKLSMSVSSTFGKLEVIP